MSTTMRRTLITATGSYLPQKIVTNDDLAKTMDTSDAWIRQRTGIAQRHMVAEGEMTSDLGIAAAGAALKSAGLDAGDIDCIILATTTPDDTFPATATAIQKGLGAHNAYAFDMQAVCSGFVYALDVGDAMIKSGKAERALIIGAESFTRLLDWEDRATAVLFGDGAGAIVLEAGAGDDPALDDWGIIATTLHADGRLRDLLFVDGGPSSTGTVGHVRMRGQEVFRHAVEKLASAMEEALARAGLKGSDVDWLIPHQANLRIIDSMQKKLGLDSSRVIRTVERHANTSAASIPLALDWAVREGHVRPGHLLAFEAIGGGLSWGAALARFGKPQK